MTIETIKEPLVEGSKSGSSSSAIEKTQSSNVGALIPIFVSVAVIAGMLNAIATQRGAAFDLSEINDDLSFNLLYDGAAKLANFMLGIISQIFLHVMFSSPCCRAEHSESNSTFAPMISNLKNSGKDLCKVSPVIPLMTMANFGMQQAGAPTNIATILSNPIPAAAALTTLVRTVMRH